MSEGGPERAPAKGEDAPGRPAYRGMSELQLRGVDWPNQLPHLSQPDRPSASAAITANRNVVRMVFPVRWARR